ncbi:unnamed protein product [Allacma fusca]|uniref:Uncharacterized protein n=1 Tax=Allacma fusca TaxID=39272 RepID=A0A8J2NSE9_9HEXA|nr:unnamed protein product [Allacma fusca]
MWLKCKFLHILEKFCKRESVQHVQNSQERLAFFASGLIRGNPYKSEGQAVVFTAPSHIFLSSQGSFQDHKQFRTFSKTDNGLEIDFLFRLVCKTQGDNGGDLKVSSFKRQQDF